MTDLSVSYAEANWELVESFERYMISRGLSKSTIVNYRYTVERLVEHFGSMSVVQARRADIHNFLAKLIGKGQSAASLNARTHGLRLFYKFLSLVGLVANNPMMHIGQRKLPKRLYRVLSIEEIEKLVAAARDPLERVVVEVFYATGMRVSELASLKLGSVDFTGEVIKIVNGKCGRDRYTLFGRHAAKAMAEYIAWRKPQMYLLEAPPRTGEIIRKKRVWIGRAYFDGVQRVFRIGKIRDLPTEEAARAAFNKITANIPGFRPSEGRPYGKRAIYGVLDRLSARAGIGRIHPHMLRRAAATHLLERDTDIRYVQEFLGHQRISTTQIYTSFTTEKLQEIYMRCHPHAQANCSEK